MLVAAFAAFILAAADRPTRSVVGQGATSCGAWTEERRSSPLVAMGTVSWLLGFVSAYNAYVAKDGRVQGDADPDALTAWLDNYCISHPLDDIDTATRVLITELASRKR